MPPSIMHLTDKLDALMDTYYEAGKSPQEVADLITLVRSDEWTRKHFPELCDAEGSYEVRGLCGTPDTGYAPRYVETFSSLLEARKDYDRIKVCGDFAQVELDNVTNPDEPDMIEHEDCEEEEEEGEGGDEALKAEIEGEGGDEALKAEIEALKAEIEELRKKGGLCVCGKWLRGKYRDSGQGLCACCQPKACTEKGCDTKLKRNWRFVGKCLNHGGYEGLPK